MNICNFTGYLTHDPELERETESSVASLRFKMVIYEYRRNKAGEKKKLPTVLTFEAWHTGAETIAKLANKGTKMTVSASARNEYVNNVPMEDVVFRVNEFDFACLDKDLE